MVIDIDALAYGFALYAAAVKLIVFGVLVAGIQTINATAFYGCNHIENVDITSKAKKTIGNYRKIFNLKN